MIPAIDRLDHGVDRHILSCSDVARDPIRIQEKGL